MAEVLIIGSGGREDALRQAMEASREVTRVEVYADVEEGRKAFEGSPDVFSIIGPEAALGKGAADYLRAAGHTVLGVSQEAAQYEASKSHAIETVPDLFPQTYIAKGPNMAEEARAFVRDNDTNYYIKADGFAGGKGSVKPEDKDHASAIVEDMIAGGYDGAGKKIINFQEECEGPEVSPIVVVGRDGDFILLPYAQDHKRLLKGDKGPNTGGTGAYTSVPESVVSESDNQQIEEMIADALEKMAATGVPLEQGVLYAGVIKALNLDKVQIRELLTRFRFMEFNVRFGDPETQPQMASMIASGVDVYRLLRSAAEGNLERPDIDLQKLPIAALTVALMAKGYPVKAETDQIIRGFDQEYPGVTLQKAGMKLRDDGTWVTSSGRVLYVTGIGQDIDEAAMHAYAAINPDNIWFDGIQYREDIGWQARKAA